MDQHAPTTRPRVIAVGCDHAGYPLKPDLLAHLEARGWQVTDVGTHSATERVDYPDFAALACAEVVEGRARFALLICGTGIGISIAANRNPAIRCAHASEPTTARLTREHNDANALALGARMIGTALATDILDAFLEGQFEGGRHTARVAKLTPAFSQDTLA